ncbi:MAG: hypothetical protein GPJ14_09620 [Microcystis aeruginosa G11-01]|jgi:phage pi2 protein 07|nr:hypothetical protein [Microcystis aeruginosa G13-10]NCS02313.1 hypothetical protein [Microcystis aeruginosa G13-11]NCS13177.1 hypothetical protein [Microcystis aeruginosa G13-09]NCS34528.1 hypothetical protein [Microcystis aeruginosa G11-01]
MDDKTKNIQPEIENLNLDEIDVEELEKRLELAAAATDVWMICVIHDNKLIASDHYDNELIASDHYDNKLSASDHGVVRSEYNELRHNESLTVKAFSSLP